MTNLGDITKISGRDVPVVDAVIGGSPCQDLSVAGKRAGLAGARSGLFMEQIRIIKEMREADRCAGKPAHLVRPRFMVWENVPGAFSSNGGNDFRRVLEEAIRVAEPDAPNVPLPAKGKWPLADCWYGDGWSIAYRVLDAQFWGVPQRRRRIALVADFGGRAAPEILFVRQSVCGDIETGGAAREEAAAGSGSGADCAVTAVHLTQDPITGEDIAPCLSAGSSAHGQASIGVNCAGFKHKAGAKAGSIGFEPEIAPTLSVEQTASVYDARGNGDGQTVCTMTGDHQSRITDYTAIVMSTGQGGIVRRLTPLECERLQGYPDGWTDIGPWRDSTGKLHKESSDSARYKALGNSIALPPWAWVLKRLCGCYERTATMASLFDGIGGFQLIWERLNGPGSCLWASEIDEFPIAVTRRRFGADERQPD